MDFHTYFFNASLPVGIFFHSFTRSSPPAALLLVSTCQENLCMLLLVLFSVKVYVKVIFFVCAPISCLLFLSIISDRSRLRWKFLSHRFGAFPLLLYFAFNLAPSLCIAFFLSFFAVKCFQQLWGFCKLSNCDAIETDWFPLTFR